MGQADGLKFTVAQPREIAGFVADPERALVCFVQGGYTAVPQTGRVARIKNDDARAIEAQQTCVSAEPQISVAGLDDRSDRVLFQAVFALPDVECERRGARAGSRLHDRTHRQSRKAGRTGQQPRATSAESVYNAGDHWDTYRRYCV